MTRGKIKLEYIAHDAERRASFKKRKKGILNKMNELCTLCDVQACTIIYSAYEPQPTVWPSPPDAQQIISRFRELPEMEQTQRLFNKESYTIQRTQKSHKQAEKLERINRLTDMEILMHSAWLVCRVCKMSLLSYITEMGRLAEQKMWDFMAQMDELEKNGSTNVQMANPNFDNTRVAGLSFQTAPGNNDAGTGSSSPENDAYGPSFRN